MIGSRFALFGLGDSSYPKFNWVGRKMFRRMEGLGAKAVVERGEGDDQNEWGYVLSFLRVVMKLKKGAGSRVRSPGGSSSSTKPSTRCSLLPDRKSVV